MYIKSEVFNLIKRHLHFGTEEYMLTLSCDVGV